MAVSLAQIATEAAVRSGVAAAIHSVVSRAAIRSAAFRVVVTEAVEAADKSQGKLT